MSGEIEALQQWGIPFSQRGGVMLVDRASAAECATHIMRNGCRFYGYGAFAISADGIQPVHLLVTPEGLAKLHSELEGLGYVRPFAASKNLRDAETGVRIEFLVSGQFPGDGKPGPIAFPVPETATEDRNGIQTISLSKLVELKLASGKSPGRLKDLGEVQELIKLFKLPLEFGSQLDKSVQELFSDLWKQVLAAPSDE